MRALFLKDNLESIRSKGQSQGSAIGNKVGAEGALLRGTLMEVAQNFEKAHLDLNTFAVNMAHHFGYDKSPLLWLLHANEDPAEHSSLRVQGFSIICGLLTFF